MPTTVEQGMQYGFDRYLTKPINLSQFMSALEDVLK
jgi:YesN/AraC family two-component response regulator